jgi:hypothetical protein
MMRHPIAALALLFALPQTAAAETLQERLSLAIRCEGQPREIVEWLDARVGEDGAEGTVTARGEELDYRIHVVLTAPIAIAGATATDVTWRAEGDEAFGGLIHARFAGDPAAVVAALRLEPAAGDAVLPGAFQRAVPDGSMCPPTVLLQPLPGTGFLLGCGWCNGG